MKEIGRRHGRGIEEAQETHLQVVFHLLYEVLELCRLSLRCCQLVLQLCILTGGWASVDWWVGECRWVGGWVSVDGWVGG